MKIELNGATVSTENTSIYEVYSIEIDEEEKTIICNDINDMLIARIIYDECKEVEYNDYNENGIIKPYSKVIIKDGELI